MTPRAIAAACTCLLTALTATAQAASPLSEARAAHPASAPLPTTIVGGKVTLHVAPAEWLAGTRHRVRISADRHATFVLPAIFTRTAASGLRYTTAHSRRVTGRSVAFRDLGLPARPYSVKVLRGGHLVALVPLRVFVPERDSEQRGARSSWSTVRAAAIDVDTTHDSDEQSETFVTVSPSNPDRIVVGYNDIDAIQKGPSVSSDGGKTFTQLTQPNTFDVRGKSAAEAGSVSGDPMSAGDTLGNVWYGGLSVAKGSAPSRIYVNRIGPDGKFQPRTVGFDNLHDGQQDKPMITVDNGPDSPTFGRIYVAWDDPGSSGVYEVVVFCDTRVAGVANPARCDDADNWTKPAKVLQAEGSYIYADLAVGPDGTVYYTYWDHSAANAIRGTVCRVEPRTNCGKDGSFAAPRNIAVLESTQPFGGVPFACPTFAAPGGRVGPDPSVEVDRATNRVYVAWGDLRENSGQTRCEQLAAAGSPPLPTNRTWDVYAATAVGDLPNAGGSAKSDQVGTKVTPDAGIAYGVDNDDDFFPWLAVDQSTGKAWLDWYTTAGDPTRRTAAFVVAQVSPGAGTKTVAGPITTVSDARSDYSLGTTACCLFGNDYGDYTGLDAVNGLVVPVWTSRSNINDDGDAHIALLRP